MNAKHLILTLTLVLAAGGVYLALPATGSHINRDNFERIHVGMSKQEVEAILGPPRDHTDGRGFFMEELDRGGYIELPITEEVIELDDDVLGRLEGRSSLGRIGIIVHGTAGLFDPGWTGKATLELSNLGRMPVALYPGMRICSMTFEQLSSRVAVPYRKKAGNKYSGQERPLASKLASETSK